MPLGCWDTAMFKSIAIVGALSVAYYTVAMGVSASVSEIYGLLAFTGLFTSVYLLTSIAGWFLIGLPVHWAICKYSSGGYGLYVLSALVTILVILALSNLGTAVFFGVVILSQVLLFKYYVSQQKT